MIDPLTAFAAAQAAIKGVKAAIALGKDIQAVSGDLMKFFEAKDAVQKAASKPKSSFAQSDTAQAFEIVMQAKVLADAERELNNYMVMSGNADLWQQLMVERNRIIQQRKVEEILAKNHAKKRKEEIEDLLTWLMAGALIILLFVLIFWWLTILMDK
jgi:predicted nucleic acid-binding Zn ribbon protein